MSYVKKLKKMRIWKRSRSHQHFVFFSSFVFWLSQTRKQATRYSPIKKAKLNRNARPRRYKVVTRHDFFFRKQVQNGNKPTHPGTSRHAIAKVPRQTRLALPANTALQHRIATLRHAPRHHTATPHRAPSPQRLIRLLRTASFHTNSDN